MDSAILERLTRLTDEEREILRGRDVKKDDYSYSDKFIVNSRKLLGERELDLRPHTRFIDFPEHGHDYMEFMYVYAGSISHVIGKETVTLERGDILFLNRHARHSIRRAGREDIGINFILSNPFLQAILICRATNYAANYYEGAYLLLAIMALVWAADSGAYFTGRMVGKTPLMPEVSPKKTREGLLGGIVFAIVVMFLGKYYGFYSDFQNHELAFLCAAFGAILFSVLGDLTESMLKRLVNIKDSGKIFPGHGGMLDRIDSQLAAVPMFLSIYWLVAGELIYG